MRLSDLRQGDIFKITQFFSDCPHFQRRIEGLGLRKGAIGRVVTKSFWGPIEVDLEGRKVAVGRGVAKKIEVRRLECPLLHPSSRS